MIYDCMLHTLIFTTLLHSPMNMPLLEKLRCMNVYEILKYFITMLKVLTVFLPHYFFFFFFFLLLSTYMLARLKWHRNTRREKFREKVLLFKYFWNAKSLQFQ